MGLTIDGHFIQRIHVIDDNPSVRESYGEVVEDLDLEPILADNHYYDLDNFVQQIVNFGDAAICDHHLRKQDYASFNGAELVAHMYTLKFPALLCTRREDADIDEIRPFRGSIPVLLKPRDLTPENIQVGLQKCISELNDNFQPSRRAWRTLVRIDDVDPEEKFFYVVVPGWDSQQVIRLRLQDLPETIKKLVLEGQSRLHAKVNLGAEANEDLYFEDWEPR
ncbi:MAG: hypothetical protein KJ077_48950 [Anaerolineae bacterium]|nr:hypothetical protein [Anaerolineae bacterium]